jgi:hypothetical protein
MKNVVLFRLHDEATVWLADLDAGTVEQADASALAATDDVRVVQPRSGAASHHFFPSR